MPLPLSEFPVGSIWKRAEIHKRLGGTADRGISLAAGKSYILIFSSTGGKAWGHDDGWREDGFFHFRGEGKVGDMKWGGGNKAIRDHARHRKILLVFEAVKDGRWRFAGPMSYVGSHDKTLPDKKGRPCRAIIFKLAKANIAAVEEQVAGGARDALRFAVSRHAALRASQDAAGTVKTAQERRLRGQAVSRYVQDRALGYCEVCGRGAPFETASGKPYLESHHLTQLADDGPDAPQDVIAACPTCHRRIHHGTDGAVINRAAHERIQRVEAAIEKKRLHVVTAAVIRDRAGRVLVARRKHGQHLSLKWEFPGGKVEAGESLEEGLEREIREELGLKIRVTGRIVMVDHKYPAFDIRLCAMKASILEGQVSLTDHDRIMWVPPKVLFHLKLAPADEHMVAKVIV